MALAQNSGLRAMTNMGCYASSETFQDQGPWTWQSSGYCQQACVKLNKPVMGLTGGTNCWCGDLLPAAQNKVDNSQCDLKCNGWDEKCGGDGKWTVWLTGIKPSVRNAEPSNSPSVTGGGAGVSGAASTTTAPTSTASPQVVVTVSGQTQTVTAAPGQDPSGTSTTSSNSKSSGGSSGASKAGIAAGVVGGVLGLCALAGGIFLYVRMRRRRAVEEEYRRNAEINKFVGAGRVGSNSSMSDSRLEPSVMAQRRMSSGSIADNQDYSRRILKVTNPDGT
ncbi:MAG: hypothetical protein M1816_007053 [Peltula sp. TS41687]|nr:MAG: hypothetical protein M1816_007053 [Peltula sp. TS41687]